jgi:endogenous inhibitor of DNA gyrase (YacG/DUF329 family)
MKSKSCPHCQKGTENEYGDIVYSGFPCSLRGAIYSARPCIFKRNKRYFLNIDHYTAIEIKACPICGRSFVEGET